MSDTASATVVIDVPSHEEILEKARALVPLLREHAAEVDQIRRPVDSVIQAIEDAGLFKLAVPRRVGGWEAPFRTWMEVAAILGEGCASTSWALIQSTQATGFMFSLNEQGQQEILSRGGALRAAGANAPTGTVTPVDGGWTVSGEWPYASGIVHADWALVGFMITNEEGNPDAVIGFAPVGGGKGEATWKDTWFVGGLRGTGSNTVVLDEVFIPSYRALRAGELARGIHRTPYDDELMFRSPLGTLGAMVCVPAALGATREALRLVAEKAPSRRITYSTHKVQAETPGVQIGLGSASAKLRVAEYALFGAADELWNALENNTPLTAAETTRFRAVATQSAQLALSAMQDIMSAASSSSFADGNPLQRIYRDVQQAALHGTLIPGTGFELHGKAVIGVE
ncbi:acyl-CoA dehydrogenase family protein [Microbacterium sp. A93]|uniref:acyl-CoA dehydrogenase family protein n=1 Tax=Microbacterium sp. A93 TaxID=3450716 RepID=UPI003F42B3D8